jgi:hypothetical protein
MYSIFSQRVYFFFVFFFFFFTVESSDSEASANEEMEEINTNKQAEETGGDPFWILDLNPDMQS